MSKLRHKMVFFINSPIPYWFSLFLASFAFITFNWLLSDHSRIFVLQSDVPAFLASPILVLGIISFYKQRHRAQLLDRESDLKVLRKMPWQDFEILLGEALRRDGFYVEEKGSSSINPEFDLVLWKNNQMVVVQCKRWNLKKIEVEAVKRLYNCIQKENADACLFVTSGNYTPAAKAFAEGKPIALADGKALLELVQSVQKDKSYEVSKYLKRASLDTFGSHFSQTKRTTANP